jgi:hypothetical protein
MLGSQTTYRIEILGSHGDFYNVGDVLGFGTM